MPTPPPIDAALPMADPAVPSNPEPPWKSSPVLVYDADCGFCTVTARWIERRLRPGRGRIVPWQQLVLSEIGLTVPDVEAMAWWRRLDGTLRPGHLAIADALVSCRLPWSLAGRAIRRRPLAPLARLVYAWVARHRYQLPGGTDACRI
jgi:predicted DCC family thiol-disulfide oxidoreductase YuxK